MSEKTSSTGAPAGAEAPPAVPARWSAGRRRQPLCTVRSRAGQIEHRVGHPALESLVVHELLEQLGVVLHDARHHPQQRLAVLDPRVLVVRVPPGVPEGGVRGDA